MDIHYRYERISNLLYNDYHWGKVNVAPNSSVTLNKNNGIIFITYSTSSQTSNTGAMLLWWSPHSNTSPTLLGGQTSSNITFSHDSDNNHVISNAFAYSFGVVYSKEV